MKKILGLLFSIICLFLIYCLFDKNKVNYVSISDNLYKYNDYVKDYLISKNRLNSFNTEFINDSINNLYKDLKNNRTIRVNNNDYYFKKILRESDFVVINVGMNEFSSSYDKYDMDKNNIYFSKMYLNIERFIHEINKYAQSKILFMGLYNPYDYYDANTDRLFDDINIKLNELMLKKNIIYIDLYEMAKDNKENIQEQIANIINFYLE